MPAGYPVYTQAEIEKDDSERNEKARNERAKLVKEDQEYKDRYFAHARSNGGRKSKSKSKSKSHRKSHRKHGRKSHRKSF